jgi:hypothetical protein
MTATLDTVDLTKVGRGNYATYVSIDSEIIATNLIIGVYEDAFEVAEHDKYGHRVVVNVLFEFVLGVGESVTSSQAMQKASAAARLKAAVDEADNAVTRSAARGELIVSNDYYDHETPAIDVQDALTDLMHYFDSIPACDMGGGVTFERVLESARNIYEDEKRDPSN